jgi:NADPH:quinone reductase
VGGSARRLGERVDRSGTMRTYATDAFGEEGTLRELPVPEPGPSEVRIRVEAAGTNPVDNAILQGSMKDMLEHRFPLVPGIDASGVIDAVGADVTTWSVGDSIFGATGKGYFGGGTYAEYTTMASASISRKRDGVGHDSAAAIPTAGVTALMLLEASSLKRVSSSSPSERQVGLVATLCNSLQSGESASSVFLGR